MKTAIFLDHEASSVIKLLAPWDPDFVEDLKDSVDYHFRNWVPEDKCWLIHQSVLGVAISVARNYYSVIRTSQLRPRQAVAPPDPDYDVLWVKRGAPPEVVQAAYRAMAKLSHPDMGDSNEAMARLNLAYERIMGAQK